MLNDLKHNIKVFIHLLGMNAKELLIYRRRFYISGIAMIVWMTIYIVLIEAFYAHTDKIAGWSKGGMIIILAFYYFITSIGNMFFRDNFDSFGETMRRGKLDQFFIKPAGFQLQCFLGNARFDQITGPVFAIFIFLYGLKELPQAPDPAHMIAGIFYAFVSVIFFYHFLLLVAASAFYLQRSDTLSSVMWNISQVGRYPRQIFSGFGKIFFEFIFPMALITTIPSEIFIQAPTVPMHFIFFIIVGFFCIVAQILFAKGLRKYSSAN
mgnify:CR=1 FL=1